MNIFCTLFDSFYLTRGLALYRSLVKTGADFRLIVYCFDDACFKILSDLKLPKLDLVTLSEFETPALLRIKDSRTRGEYCWTCTPHVIADALTRFHLSEVTYLDADLFFFSRPELLLEEFKSSGGSVLITEHRYTPEYDQSTLSGTYCVQFITFCSDSNGLTALNWWKDRCTEWCFSRFENGKFGDQKYLDDWTTRFKGVHVLKHLGGGVAPWNIQQYEITGAQSGPLVNGAPVVFYHFHALKWLKNAQINLTGGSYKLPDLAVEFIYRPYVRELKASLEQAQTVSPGFESGKIAREPGLRMFLHDLKCTFKGTYHVVQE